MVARHHSSGAVQRTTSGSISPVAEAFDRIADSFDSNLENETTARLREKLYLIVESLVRPGSIVLDINCGTGIDALHLAHMGYRIWGADISRNMVAAAKRKLKKSELRNAEFIVSSFDHLSPEEVPMADLTFSNFGGLNCTSDLVSAASAIAAVTRPGGYFVGVLMPPFSLWESFSYALHGQWRLTLRRAGQLAQATGFGENGFPVHYYSPHTTAAAFSEYFDHKKTIGWSIVSPTPQSRRFVQRHPVIAKMLVRIDGFIEEFPLFRSIGDHYVTVFQRKQ